jgi:hypothetical protein
MNLLESVEFRISVSGEKSGETYVGTFKCLRRLSHRQELTRDVLYRNLLGEKPDSASPRAKEQAELFSDLQVCLTDSPVWWKEAGGGLDLVDDEVVKKIWTETIRIRVEAIKEVQDRAKDADADLKQIAESGELTKTK